MTTHNSIVCSDFPIAKMSLSFGISLPNIERLIIYYWVNIKYSLHKEQP